MSWLERTFYGNPLADWGIALAIAVALAIALYFLQGGLVRRLRRLADRTEARAARQGRRGCGFRRSALPAPDGMAPAL